jgi:hypothetical protein
MSNGEYNLPKNERAGWQFQAQGVRLRGMKVAINSQPTSEIRAELRRQRRHGHILRFN